MGLVHNSITGDGCQIGFWEITEDYETLLRITRLTDEDIRRLNTFGNHYRKLESLSVRALLQKMTKPDARVIYRDQSRKPYMDDGTFNISISHSHKCTAILLSKDRQVGIDIEYMSHDIEKLAHKFISKSEVITSNRHLRREHLYIHWCAKEALYKICDKESINFQENLIIKPFEPNPQGDITGLVNNNSRYEEYAMHYRLQNRYALVYCTH